MLFKNTFSGQKRKSAHLGRWDRSAKCLCLGFRLGDIPNVVEVQWGRTSEAERIG